MSRGLIDQALEKIANELYFQSGETITISGRFTGIMTSGSTSMQFSVVLPKSLANITSARVTNIVGGIRISTGGYADNHGDGVTWSDVSGITLSTGMYKDYYMTFNINKDTSFKQNGTTTAVVNNTPVTLGGSVTFEFT